jgi:hypothetical protein
MYGLFIDQKHCVTWYIISSDSIIIKAHVRYVLTKATSTIEGSPRLYFEGSVIKLRTFGIHQFLSSNLVVHLYSNLLQHIRIVK